MTTRRGLLTLAGTTALGMGVAACTAREASPPPKPLTEPTGGDLLAVALAGGLAVIDTTGGQKVVPPLPGVASPDWTTVVQAQDVYGGTQVTARSVTDGDVVSSGRLRDQLRPRAVSPDGRLVALTTAPVNSPAPQPFGPAPQAPAAGTGAIEAGRTRTTVVVADASGERRRLDLAGNIVPEAFSADGNRLFVLDYLPPAAPDRYRVRAIDLRTGLVRPLLTRTKQLVPPGAEEEMRGEGRQAVYAPRQSMLFTLYTHQPDHVHTRDQLAATGKTGSGTAGARADKPHVHAFVHSLNLAIGWAYCIDLPAPFGGQPAAGHAIALDPGGSRLVVVDAPGGVAALIDPVGLTVESVSRFAPLPAGEAAATLTADAQHLLVGAGREVVMLPVRGGEPLARWTYDTPVRGVALSSDGDRLYVGQTDQVLGQVLTGDLLPARTPAAGLLKVEHLVGRTTG